MATTDRSARRRPPSWATGGLLSALLAVGCGGGDAPAPNGSGGRGGANGSGGAGGANRGAGGTGAGGTTPGGAASGGSGAASGGASGAASGGGDGSGVGTGGNQAPGGAGGVPAAGGTGGALATGGSGGGADASAPPDAPAGTGPTLDECFTGLRPLVGRSQIATKQSADDKYQVRIALEVLADGVGTSGTVVWKLIRVGIVTPGSRVCWKDEAALGAAYKQSHHNCSDLVTLTAAGTNYQVTAPDTDPSRPTSKLQITRGTEPATVVPLGNVTCKANTPTCKSGGPC